MAPQLDFGLNKDLVESQMEMIHMYIIKSIPYPIDSVIHNFLQLFNRERIGTTTFNPVFTYAVKNSRINKERPIQAMLCKVISYIHY